MKPFAFLSNLFRTKSSETAPFVFAMYGHQTNGIYHNRNPAQYADDAFKRNVIAYRAITVVSRACAFVPLEVHIGEKKMEEDHPLVKLLKRPNPWQGGSSFIESVIGYYLLTGNTYIEGVGPENEAPRELWSLRSDRMRVIPNEMGVGGYVYEVNGRKKIWKCDPIEGKSQIMHMRTWNPLSDWYGMSPVEAAAYAIDGHNMSGEWNQALLQNSARPSGALVYKADHGATMTEKQFERLKEQINAAYSGTRNAGRPVILEGDLDWKQMSLSPADMDWINGKATSAREIAQVFGVPSQILGIPGDNTYSNYQEARQSLYEDTIVPILDQLCDNLNVWIAPAFGEQVVIKANLENLPALAPKREKLWNMVTASTWLTVNEKRKLTGFDEIDAPEADEVMIPSGIVPLTMQPDPAEGGVMPNGEEDPLNEDPENADEEATEEEPIDKVKPGQKPVGKKPFPPKKPEGKKFFAFLSDVT